MLRFFLIINDPKGKNAKMFMALRYEESREEAWVNYLKWLEGKIIGDPQATETYTVDELKEMGFVGVYMPLLEIETE